MPVSWILNDKAALFLHEESEGGDWRADLSAEEQARAEKMGAPARAKTFLLSRALLRKHLAARLGVAPVDVPIILMPQGKPVLAAPHAGISFSLSHAAGRILIGIMEGGALGVDIERVDPARDIEKIAARIFTPEDRARIAAAAPAEKTALAFQTWCLTEARYKMGNAASPLKEHCGVLDGGFAWAVCYEV